jgi:hypothetical protein
VLSDELLTLPDLVRGLTEGQRRTDEHVAALAEAQRRAEERLAGVEERLAGVEERLAGVEERLAGVEERMVALIEVVRILSIDVGELKGDALERRYRERAYAYFAPLLRRVRVLTGDELLVRLEGAIADRQLSEAEAEQVTWADLVILGRRREDDAEMYLVVEVSWQVDVEDVARTAERAALLGRTGIATIPAVAGKTVTEAAERLARRLRVWQVTDGRVVRPSPS